MSRALSPWGYLPDGWRLSTIKEEMVEVTDYVANGSFASLAENVQYKQEEDYAVLIRLVDYNNGFKDGFVYIDEHAYNFLGKSKLFGGEIIISNVGANVGTVFKAPYLKKPMSLAPNAICVKLKGNNDFYYYWFKSRIGQYSIDSLVSGSAQPKFNKTHFKSMPIPVPPIHEQDEIASILSSLDDKIAVNKKICENLEAQAQALFKHWFIDFAPFKDGNFCANREQNETCFNSAEVQPKITGKACKFVDSELGLIPEGWRVGTFIDLIDVMPGGTPSTSVSEYWDNATIPFFSPKDVNGVYCFDTEKHITEKGLNNCSSHLYPKDTLFITARGTVGKIVLAAVPMAMNQSNYALVGKEGVGKFYLYLLTQTIVSALLKKANGAVFLAITTKDFKENIVYPPFEIISIFETKVKPMFDKIHVLMNESRHLAELRDTLLPKLMSGQIKVNEIERAYE